ncbi:MAG: glycosyltransferase [Opitutaceae bacterium]
MTKGLSARHRSGLTRVSARLCDELGADAQPISWLDWNRVAAKDDWFLTCELFSEDERPGLGEFLKNPPCRLAAVFHDAIPLQWPQITWPRSVARHPGYMKMLAGFDRVFAVSAASRRDLVEFWRWQGVEPRARVETILLGADFDGAPRVTQPPTFNAQLSTLLCVGIVEPRKNQAFLLEVCAGLWREGLSFELHLVGRVNPHFGRPIVAQIKSLQKLFPGLYFHKAADDGVMAALYAQARASLFPTRAEGCGLPLLEALWRGVPCVCSDLPVLRENAAAGGCLAVAPGDPAAWTAALRAILTDDAVGQKLQAEARSRPLPCWADTAASLRAALGREVVGR